MTSFLLTEIALDLLGNKFYTVDGKHVRELQALYNLKTDETQSTGEKDLMCILGISETSLNAADNNADEIISLDDDDEDEGNSDVLNSNNMSNNRPMPPEHPTINKSVPQSKKFVGKHTQKISVEDNNKGNVPSTSRNICINKPKEHAKKEKQQLVPINSDSDEEDAFLDKNSTPLKPSCMYNYKSDDLNERLFYIIKASSEEYRKMKCYACTLKKSFLDTNKKLINLKDIKEEDFLQRFYLQQKLSLVEESQALMQFIKIIKNEDIHPSPTLHRVASDILQAKELLA